MAHGIPWYFRARVVLIPAAAATVYWTWFSESAKKEKEQSFVVANPDNALSIQGATTKPTQILPPSSTSNSSNQTVKPVPIVTAPPPVQVAPISAPPLANNISTPSPARISPPSTPSSAPSPLVASLPPHPSPSTPTPSPSRVAPLPAVIDTKNADRVPAIPRTTAHVEPPKPSSSQVSTPSSSPPQRAHAPRTLPPAPVPPVAAGSIFKDDNPMFDGLQLRFDWLTPRSSSK